MAWRQLNVRYTCYKTQKHANSPQAQKIENCIVLVDIFIKMSSNTTMTSYFFPNKKSLSATFRLLYGKWKKASSFYLIIKVTRKLREVNK